MHHPLLGVSVLLSCAAPLCCQHDLIGATFTGEIVGFNSHTGDGVLINTAVVAGQNAMARVGDRLFTTDRVTPPGSNNFTFSLGLLNPQSGSYARTQAAIGDMRGLAAHPTSTDLLYGIRDGSPDELVTIHTGTGAVTTIGSTGRTGIQALTLHQRQLFAWDVSLGLLRVSTTTGLATDVNPAVGGSTDVQFLVGHTDGRLLGGRINLFEIDPATGVATSIATIAGGAFDLRGAEERLRVVAPFGSGCDTPAATPSVLNGSGALSAGTSVLFQSSGHQPSSFTVLVVGFDTTSASGQPLPLLLDPLLGTAGCSLFVRPDATLTGVTSSQGLFARVLSLPISLPPMFAFFAQLAVFEASPGGMSWSNGLMVRLGS